ncbi:MAG TPA: prepilin-type N-terminal cleavage/methylation domain-containing protein [Kofleriaceae bacterium]|nr:prepilin-type N-terminal cleavage/methylation domain-containing protein [Kofleriaceae bacterium]
MTQRRRDAGFTMIEVMIAVLLTALAVIGVIALFRVETRASGYSRHETEAAVLAQDRLEELRTQAAGLVSTTETTLNDLGTTVPPGMYTRVSLVAASADPSVYDITVTVSWDESGDAKSVVVRGRR